MCVCVVVCQAKSANIDSDDVCLDRYFPAKVMQDLIAEASRLKGAKPTEEVKRKEVRLSAVLLSRMPPIFTTRLHALTSVKLSTADR